MIDRVVNQLVMEMNTITKDKPILVVAVCNRVEDLPPALRATGRFGTELPMKHPDLQDRLALFQMYLSRDWVCFTGDVDAVAANADGLSGGDIEEICRRVILQAAKSALELSPDAQCEVQISQDDVIKMLDRWKLAACFRTSF